MVEYQGREQADYKVDREECDKQRPLTVNEKDMKLGAGRTHTYCCCYCASTTIFQKVNNEPLMCKERGNL